MKTFEYRLFTSREQEQRLLSCLRESRHLYNQMLETVKSEYESSGKFLTKYDLTARFKMHRSLEGTPKTTHLVLRADGPWYALIVCDTYCEIEEPEDKTKKLLPDSSEQVGIDVGLKVFLADSDGNTVENPRWYRASERTLRRKQRALCRCHKGSRRRSKAARNVARTHLKVARQRKDFLHKVARQYVNRYQTLVVEDLNISGMVKNHHLDKSISDASWAAFVAFLSYKAANAGRQVVTVPAQYTSQRCFACGELVPKSLSVRTHVCGHCGHVEDRDINAARNILRAGARPSEANVVGCGKRSPRSPRL